MGWWTVVAGTAVTVVTAATAATRMRTVGVAG